jgi:hypothetical protein
VSFIEIGSATTDVHPGRVCCGDIMIGIRRPGSLSLDGEALNIDEGTLMRFPVFRRERT